MNMSFVSPHLLSFSGIFLCSLILFQSHRTTEWRNSEALTDVLDLYLGCLSLLLAVEYVMRKRILNPPHQQYCRFVQKRMIFYSTICKHMQKNLNLSSELLMFLYRKKNWIGWASLQRRWWRDMYVLEHVIRPVDPEIFSFAKPGFSGSTEKK